MAAWSQAVEPVRGPVRRIGWLRDGQRPIGNTLASITGLSWEPNAATE
jgi:hypothetical protein